MITGYCWLKWMNLNGSITRKKFWHLPVLMLFLDNILSKNIFLDSVL